MQKPGLNDSRINEIVSKINRLMDRDKLYQETEFTLQDLAKKFDYPSHQVSQIINDGMNKKNYGFVNGYRVEEAKRLVLNPVNRNYTILPVCFCPVNISSASFPLSVQATRVSRSEHKGLHLWKQYCVEGSLTGSLLTSQCNKCR